LTSIALLCHHRASAAASSTKTVHSDAISNRASAKTQGAINHFRTGK
jgi:hypothetical protein